MICPHYATMTLARKNRRVAGHVPILPDWPLPSDPTLAIADRLSENPGLRREDVLVFLTSNERDEWSFGNGIASYVKDAEPA